MKLKKESWTPKSLFAGCFCTGKCNRDGVTVVVDDKPFVGITKENFNEFFKEHVLSKTEEA